MGLLRSKCAMHINVLYVLDIFHENGKRHVTATLKTPKKNPSARTVLRKENARDVSTGGMILEGWDEEMS